MNVVVVIEGREAVPVRAIPLLTNWNFFTPDVVAQVLADDEAQHGFLRGELRAFYLENGEVRPFQREWWRSWAARELRVLSENIKASEPSHEVGYQQWRNESLSLLPAGALVWKDTLERFHARNWDGRFRVLSSSIPTGDDGAEESPTIGRAHASFINAGIAALEKWRELDFTPYIRPALREVVMEDVPPQHMATVVVEAPSESKPADNAKTVRQAMLVAMRERMKSIEIHDDEAEPEQELENAVPSVSTHLRALDEIAEPVRVARGAYTDLYPAPPATTSSAAPAAPVVLEGASDEPQAARVGAAGVPHAKPWFAINADDPTPEQPWFTPARYFARQLVTDDSTLLTKRLILAGKVSQSLAAAGIFKRGGKKPHVAETVLKAFANVALG